MPNVFLTPKVYGGSTTLQVDPLNSSCNYGETLSVNITVTDVANLTGWELKLFYLNSVLNCTDIAEGPFLRSIGDTFRVFDIVNQFNSTHGRILAACALLGMNKTANGNGVLATVTFNSTAPGQTALDLQDTKLSDEKIPPQPIPHVSVDGTARVIPPLEQVVDVYTQRGGTGNNTSSDAFSPGETVLFNASVRYLGAPVQGAIVQFTTYDSLGAPTIRTSVTGPDGIAASNVTLSSNAVFGNYTTIASVNIQGQGYNDTVTFVVGWIICFQQVGFCNCSGAPQTSFPRGNPAYVNITLQSISFNPKQIFLLIQGNDFLSQHTIAHEWIRTTVLSGKTALTMGFRVPPWSTPGDGQVFIGVYTEPPWSGGLPYCPGVYLTLPITGT